MRSPQKFKFRKLRGSSGYRRGAKIQSCKWPTGSAHMALVSLGSGRVTEQQMEAGRVVIARGTRRLAKVTMPCFPNVPITQKPNNSRMGKGKGDVHHHVFVACPGDVLFRVEGNRATTKLRHLKLWEQVLAVAGVKMPFDTLVVPAPTFPADTIWDEEVERRV